MNDKRSEVVRLTAVVHCSARPPMISVDTSSHGDHDLSLSPPPPRGLQRLIRPGNRPTGVQAFHGIPHRQGRVMTDDGVPSSSRTSREKGDVDDENDVEIITTDTIVISDEQIARQVSRI